MSAPLALSEAPVLEGKYSLVRELGSDSAGTVYEAENLMVGKRVAIKVLNGAIAADSDLRTRLVAEARAAARIAHANVVDIHDLGVTAEGVPYLVMELLEGPTLAELVADRGALPPSNACELVLQLLAGLAAAHKRGILHGDLKPANVIVTYPRPDRPLVKVIDLGVARALWEINQSNALGAPLYWAPEQATGQPQDERTDVYSACAILYLLLTGQDPFSAGTSRALLEQVARGAVRPARSVNPRIPEELASILQAGMAPKRKDRISSAEELAEKLRGFANPDGPHAPSGAHPLSQPAILLRRPFLGPTQAPSEMPLASVIRVDVTPRLLTDSLLMSPRLPRAPAPPKLEIGRDFMPLLGDPARNGADRRSLPTRRLARRKKTGLGPAVMAMAVGFGSGVVLAWAAGLI